MALGEHRPTIGGFTWAYGFAVACLVAAHTLHPTGNLGQATYVLVTLGAAMLAVAGARRQPRSRRFPWTCIALGLTFSAIGDVIFYLLLLSTGVAPAVSLADAFWLAAYIALAVGLSSLVVGIDILKIDRSFTNTITDRSHTPAIVRGLLDLARTLNMETVAEGIELDVQLDSLRDQHCDFGQGFLFAKPLNADDAATLIADLQLVAPVATSSR
jgi:hypothetical protein